MKLHCRTRRDLPLLVWTALLVAAPLRAQSTVGKVEGTVNDPNGQPVAGAQILILGTSLGATTNDAGYYFINNVPAGVYTLRSQFIGFSPAEVRGVRVLADQTATVNFDLQRALELGAITIVVQQNPIVPRDQVATKSIVTGTLVNDLPVDNIRDVLALQPGVVESGKGAGLSIRGGRPGEAAVYVDGALTRSQFSGGARLNVGTNALEEASITTGAIGTEFGEAQSGVVAFVTRSGGAALNGALSYQTDEPFGNGASVGYNRLEGSVGGPLMGDLTFFAAGSLTGQQSPLVGKGWAQVPTYVLGGLDTTVTVPAGGGNLSQVDIPRFIQYGGTCDPADNFAFACQGQIRPYNWQSGATGNAKLQYTYGGGSRISSTVLWSQNQARNWNPTFAYQRSGGTRDWNRGMILDWSQQLARSTDRALSFNVNLSYQNDRQITGPLSRDYEVDHRSPWLGMVLSPMDFVIDFNHFSDDDPTDPRAVTQLRSQDDWDRLINNVRTNRGTRTPYLDRQDLRNSQAYRDNPWALSTGVANAGWDVFVSLYQERRLSGRANVDWQVDRYNRMKFGGEANSTRVNWFAGQVLRQSFMQAYTERPVRYGAYAEDRLDLGDVVVDLGVRWDYFSTGAYIPVTPGVTFSHPNFDPANPLDPADGVFTKAASHTTWSPRLRVSFPVTDKTGFRLSYAHQVQTPDLQTMLSGFNNDLSFTNTNDVFGRDLTFGKTILFEFGIRHAFSQDLVVDVSAYNKDKVSDFSARIREFADPTDPNGQRTQFINVLTNADFGNVRGADVSLTRRIGSFFNATASYTFQVAKNTGSDPLSYLRTTSRQISAVTGERVDPPQAILPTDDNRTHNFNGALSLSFPGEFADEAWYGSLLRNSGIFLRYRFVSGLPYTRLKNDGNGQTVGTGAPLAFGLSAQQAEPINSSTLPWTKELDLRVTKGIQVAGTELTAFADIRNLLNLTTINNIFAETGDEVNAEHRERQVNPEVERLRQEAGSFLRSTEVDGEVVNEILLPGNCDEWSSGPVNCVLLKRAEARFGNGDGVYTEPEYRTAFNQQYDLIFGRQWGRAAPRSIRLGVELRF
ncbi:MAG TPA: TonB-dependent receptor [Gemmatimonadales bacterium]|nr:TonB-dependent receptor [Gemmatimonadales bacterium]